MTERKFFISGEEIQEVGNFGNLIIYDLENAPAFTIPFRSDDLGQNQVGLYNELYRNKIPVFWRSFGIIGYFFDERQLREIQKLVAMYGLSVYCGLPIDAPGSFSFVIFSGPPYLIINAGSSAVVAAYKGSTYLANGEITKDNSEIECFRISDNSQSSSSSCIVDRKGIGLELLPSNYLYETLEQISPPSNLKELLSLIPMISLPLSEERLFGSLFILKIDGNGSTKKKISNGDWLGLEKKYTFLMYRFISNLSDEVYLIDPIGESVVIVCPEARFVADVYKELKRVMRELPDVDLTAVGMRVPGITLIRSADGIPLSLSPRIKESTGWRPLEIKYKGADIKRRRGTFYIEKYDFFSNKY